jgi:hypothetical protein
MPEKAEKALTEEEREDLLEAFKNFDKVRWAFLLETSIVANTFSCAIVPPL